MDISKPTLHRNNVDLSTDELVRHWTKHLAATHEEIAMAIEKVGNNCESVRKELHGLKASKKNAS